MRQKHYLEAAARQLRDSCPGQARYLLWTYGSPQDAKSTFEGTCPYCFQLLVLDNCRVRLKPKPKLTAKIQKLLNREARNTLSFKEAKIVQKYKDSKSILLITCKTCNRTVRHHGKSRSFLSALKSNHPATPTRKLSLKTPERKTPSSANRNRGISGSRSKSPALIFRTPTSGQSTPTYSSKNASKTKKHFSKLKMLLSQSESPKNPKADFRNFLSSL